MRAYCCIAQGAENLVPARNRLEPRENAAGAAKVSSRRHRRTRPKRRLSDSALAHGSCPSINRDACLLDRAVSDFRGHPLLFTCCRAWKMCTLMLVTCCWSPIAGHLLLVTRCRFVGRLSNTLRT